MRRIVCEPCSAHWVLSVPEPGEKPIRVTYGTLHARSAPEETRVNGVRVATWEPDDYACDDCSKALAPGDRAACISDADLGAWEGEYLDVRIDLSRRDT